MQVLSFLMVVEECLGAAVAPASGDGRLDEAEAEAIGAVVVHYAVAKKLRGVQKCF